MSSVELRGRIPRDLMVIVDAVARARGMSRIGIVEDVLHQWASSRVDEATLLLAVTRGNPLRVDDPRSRRG